MSFLRGFFRNRFVLVMSSLVAIATVLAFYAYAEAGMAVDHELARLQQRGELIEPEQLYPGPCDGRLNAAPLYDAAVGLCAPLSKCSFVETSAATLDRSPEPCRQEIAAHGAVFRLLAEAYERPSCVYEVLPFCGPWRRAPNFLAIRRMAQLAGVKAMLDVREHRYAEALATTSHMLKFEARFAHNTGMIEEMVIVAAMHYTLEPLEAMVASGVHADYGPVLRDLAVARSSRSEHFVRSVEMDRMNAIAVYRADRLNSLMAEWNGPDEDWGTAAAHQAWRIAPALLARLDERRYLEAVARQYDQICETRLDLHTADWSEERLAARRALVTAVDATPPTWALVSRCMMAGYGCAFVQVDKMLHRIDCLEVRAGAL